jgi:hypothetical protein
MSFHNERHVKRTRADRKCDWCWEPINAGEPSVSTSGTQDGDFYSCRYHPECNDAMNRFAHEVLSWGDPLPQDRMNRGGIEPYGEEEKP